MNHTTKKNTEEIMTQANLYLMNKYYIDSLAKEENNINDRKRRDE